MGNPFNFSAPRAKRPRNSFDLSRDDVFSKPAGLITPAYVLDVMRGDFIKIDVGNFTRTNTLNSAAYTRFKECVDYYFVPYRLIWQWYTDFISQVPNTASAINPNSSNGVPVA